MRRVWRPSRLQTDGQAPRVVSPERASAGRSVRPKPTGILVITALVLTLAAHAGPPQRPPEELLDVEGPLRNDAFVAVSEVAQEALRAGDDAWFAATAADTVSANDAFDAWRRALVESLPGDAVRLVVEGAPTRWPDPDGSHGRRTEGVVYAVLRRLGLLPATARAEWTARFEPLAEIALAGAGADVARLARVERDHPLTTGAARAALRLSDIELERGHPDTALTWLERAQRHLRDRTVEPGLIGAFAARRTTTLAIRGPVTEAGRAAWRTTRSLTLRYAERIDGGGRASPGSSVALGRDIEPGLCFLPDASAVIQTVGGLIRIEAPSPASPARLRIGRFGLRDLIGEGIASPYSSESSGGWPMLPAAHGRSVCLVVGRARPGRGNQLTCIDFDSVGLASLRWSVSSDSDVELPQEGTWEFQPGPVVVDDRVFVQARVEPDDAGSTTDAGESVWLLAFAASDGTLAWSRFLTQAADLRSDLGSRFGGRSAPATSGQPLETLDGRVFVGTNLGLGFLWDAADGRQAWSIQSRRRDPSSPGWAGSRRPPWSRSAAGVPRIVWAPFDSDRLYTLLGEPDVSDRGLLEELPLPIENAADVVGGSGGSFLVLARDGARQAVRTWHPDGTRSTSLYLGHGERFTGTALASEERVLVASDRGLYVFDRTRDLLLLDAEPLPTKGSRRGGGVYGLGEWVYVVGADTLWVLQAH